VKQTRDFTPVLDVDFAEVTGDRQGRAAARATRALLPTSLSSRVGGAFGAILNPAVPTGRELRLKRMFDFPARSHVCILTCLCILTACYLRRSDVPDRQRSVDATYREVLRKKTYCAMTRVIQQKSLPRVQAEQAFVTWSGKGPSSARE